MKTLVTLDEAFSEANFEDTEAALFDMNKAGVYDPNFLQLAKQNLTTVTAIELIDELMPPKAFQSTRVFVQ